MRCAEKRLAGLDETGERGAKPKYTVETNKRILALLDESPPKGYARWTGPLLAVALGDVDVQYVWRFLRAQKVDLAGRKSWCESSDPEFVVKAADVVGLYMGPPENAIVVCVDEKLSIQALERAQGFLKLPNGLALTGHSHEYKRNGTSKPFAIFEVATGKVMAAHKKRRRRVEFLDFMNDIVAAHADTAITSSSTTSTPTNQRMTAGSSVIRTYTSTSRRRALPGSTRSKSGSRSWKPSRCTAPPSHRLRTHSDGFIEAYNETAEPSGPKPRSIKNASKHVSPNDDSGD